jgi:hypothetical protein
MDSPGDDNVYRPLNVEKREIRVLEILPPDASHVRTGAESKIAVELETCSLDRPIAYEALSYTGATRASKQSSASTRPRTSSSDKTLSWL